MNMNQYRTGIKRWLVSSGWVILVALVVHYLYAVWPWPEYRGGRVLEQVLRHDIAQLQPLVTERFVVLLQWVMAAIYQVFFVWTGLDWLVGRAMDPRPIDEIGGEAFRRLVLAAWSYFLEPFYYSLQILAVRISVLFSALPLFGLAAGIGAVNGWVGRYLRRTGGGKESGYIYHRVKQAFWWAMAGCWAVYLVPPCSLDPRWLLPPFLLATLILSWMVVHWFKKRL